MGIDVSSLGGGSSAEIFKFDEVGATIVGTIVSITEQPVPETFVDGKPVGQKLSKKGQPLTQFQFVIDTGTGEKRFYSKWRMAKAIADAARRAGSSEVEVGDILSVTRIADVKGAGTVPAHDFEATYERASVSESEGAPF